MAFTVGLTGGIGSGKSTVARAFEAHGIAVVDADAIAHQLTAPGGAAIAAIDSGFGPEFIEPGGALDRAKMRVHVFSRPEERKRLEAILHPLIRMETSRQADAAHSTYRILMIPLLVEAQGADPAWRSRFDRILVVDCSEETQVSRVMARSGLTETAVRAIMASQVERTVRKAAADDIVDNDGVVDTLPAQVERLHRHYLALAAASEAGSTAKT